jgi:hypothetical protein
MELLVSSWGDVCKWYQDTLFTLPVICKQKLNKNFKTISVDLFKNFVRPLPVPRQPRQPRMGIFKTRPNQTHRLMSNARKLQKRLSSCYEILRWIWKPAVDYAGWRTIATQQAQRLSRLNMGSRQRHYGWKMQQCARDATMAFLDELKV